MDLGQLQSEIRRLIAASARQAEAREDAERRSGKLLVNGLVARLMFPPLLPDEIPETFFPQSYELAHLYEDGETRPRLLVVGETRYLASRHQWGAYKPALKILQDNGIEDESLLYSLFHYVLGVIVFVKNNGRILIGLRSANLGGTHTGMLSFPAGLMEPGETLSRAAFGELNEESGIGAVQFDLRIVAVRNPDAPSTTFCMMAETVQSKVRETFEAKGKKFIWVSIADVLRPALVGDTKPMVAAFRAQGIDIPDEVKIAPDAFEGLNKFGFGG